MMGGVRGVLLDLDGVIYVGEEPLVTELDLQPEQVVMVGDDIRTDVQGAQQAGLTGILVPTGTFTPADLTGEVTPDAVLGSIADLPRWWARR